MGTLIRTNSAEEFSETNSLLGKILYSGLPRSGKKFWKMKNFPGQGITFAVREIFKKNEKSHGKVREFQNFPKKMLVNMLLEILVSIICKKY